jgi:ELWxxDGT repeat protein
VTDGTPAGTHVLNASLAIPYTYEKTESMADNGLLYFIASDGTLGTQLWQTDGTTTTLADPSQSAAGYTPTDLFGGASGGLIFAATDQPMGSEPWVLPLASASSATFVKTDGTTFGTWTGTYGGDGYSVVGGDTRLPAYASLDTSNAQYWQWASSSQADYRAPQISLGGSLHEAACDFSGTSFTIDLNLAPGQSHQVALYLLDNDYQGRVRADCK